MITKISVWKKWLSHIIEITLESTSSKHNPVLVVSLDRGSVKLSTDTAIYSYGEKYDNFGDLFKAMDLGSVKDVLVLGLGLGSIPVLLENCSFNDFSFTCVEIDEEVIYLASKYTIGSLRSPCQIIHADVAHFIEVESRKFDLITVDIFDSDIIPDVFQTVDFLERLKLLLKKRGVVLYNRLAFTEEDTIQSQKYFDEIFIKSFPMAKYYLIKGNFMLISHDGWLKNNYTL